MRAIFKVLACVAALAFVVACGPKVTGNPTEDAKTCVELAKSNPRAADEFAKEVEAAYGDDLVKVAEFAKACVELTAEEVSAAVEGAAEEVEDAMKALEEVADASEDASEDGE